MIEKLKILIKIFNIKIFNNNNYYHNNYSKHVE